MFDMSLLDIHILLCTRTDLTIRAQMIIFSAHSPSIIPEEIAERTLGQAEIGFRKSKYHRM